MAGKERQKPRKPRPSFPLTAHPNGQWCKKIRGQVRFFGVWSDSQGALRRYRDVAGDLHAGRTPRRVSSRGLTVKDACNAFLGWQQEKMEAGEIGPRWFEDCRSILMSLAAAVGKNRLVADLRPDDFQRYRSTLAKNLGVYALTRHITAIIDPCIANQTTALLRLLIFQRQNAYLCSIKYTSINKSVFRYAYETDLIEYPLKFGKGFAKPSAAQERKAKRRTENENGGRLFGGTEVKQILDASNGWLQAAVLLGINGGFGNTDCATLPVEAVDFDEGVIEYARPKTGVERVVPLWPETLDALGGVIRNRPHPENEAAARLVFLTSRGKPVVRQVVRPRDDGTVAVSNTDEVSLRFSRVLDGLKIRRRGVGFYSLRHTFRTWADETKDQHAIHRIMGHAIPGMSGIYVQEIELDRLRVVVEHVRQKLFSQ